MPTVMGVWNLLRHLAPLLLVGALLWVALIGVIVLVARAFGA